MCCDDRKGLIRVEAKKRGVPLTALAFHAGIPYYTLLYGLQNGMKPEREKMLLQKLDELVAARMDGVEI